MAKKRDPMCAQLKDDLERRADEATKQFVRDALDLFDANGIPIPPECFDNYPAAMAFVHGTYLRLNSEGKQLKPSIRFRVRP
jgi:hypothetical protein